MSNDKVTLLPNGKSSGKSGRQAEVALDLHPLFARRNKIIQFQSCMARLSILPLEPNFFEISVVLGD